MDKEQQNAIFDSTREAVQYLDDDMLDQVAMFHKNAILDEKDREHPMADWIEYNGLCLSAAAFEMRDRETYPHKPRKYHKIGDSCRIEL